MQCIRGGIQRGTATPALVLTMIFVAGCGVWPRQLPPKPAGTTTAKQPPPEASGARTSEVFYTAEAGVTLYAKPAFGSQQHAELPRHQKVRRSAIERGFAQVEVDGTGQKGWVENAHLIWKLPAPEKQAAVPVPAAASVDDAPPSATGLPDVPAQSTDLDGADEARPAVFDPF